jgi:hypothetical protein
MTAAAKDRGDEMEEAQPRNEELVSMPRCTRCKLSYVPARSTSALKLTYCSFLCELGDLGFSISGLENMELIRKDAPAETALEPEPVA